MQIGVVREKLPGENRVALSPSACAKVLKLGFEVVVEAGAGNNAGFSDKSYKDVGASVADGQDVWSGSDVITKINAPISVGGTLECMAMKKGALLICMFMPRQNEELAKQIAPAGISLISLDAIPRITRAQKMDVLSSMANIAGYRAIIEASHHFGSFFTGQITAAGKVPPAKVLVIGAGVAGLAALGAAKGLGAVVFAFDTREDVKEQVESLGGKFLQVDIAESGEGGGGYAKVMSQEFIDAEMALFREQAKEVDIVITTALIPGKKAPTLWTKDMVESMKPGSVVVDLAAAQGGNCELSEDGKVVDHGGVKILGYSDLPSRMAHVSSDLFGTNIYHLLDEMGGAEEFTIDEDNDVVRQALVLRDGDNKWPPPKMAEPSRPPQLAPKPAPASTDKVAVSKSAAADVPKPPVWTAVIVLALAGLWAYMRWGASEASFDEQTEMLMQRLTVFVLACFIGWQVVWNVTAALHTPLMSVTNAISGIIIVGGLILQTSHDFSAPIIIGSIAVLFAMINIAGGFFVTHRMLKMFRK